MKIYPKLSKDEKYYLQQVEYWTKIKGNYTCSLDSPSYKIIHKLNKLGLIKKTNTINIFEFYERK